MVNKFTSPKGDDGGSNYMNYVKSYNTLEYKLLSIYRNYLNNIMSPKLMLKDMYRFSDASLIIIPVMPESNE